MDKHTLIILSMLFLASAGLLIGGALLRRAWQLMHSEKVLNRRIDLQQHPELQDSKTAGTAIQRWLDKFANQAAHWIETPLGRQLVAEEDHLLLDQCGVNGNRGKSLFFIARLVLGISLPCIAWIFFPAKDPFHQISICFFALGLGYMWPKWFVQLKARKRRLQAAEELPLLIDLLRLLQGVGLSIDQSLNVVETEFASALPILSKELKLAARQYMNGRTREQSLHRISTIYKNDDLSAIARLIVQVDRYGGAVQQPLQQFSDRIREQRKLYMKEKVGKLTVKMTAVMVATLLPALLIITGGSGFIAIIRTLAKIGHG